jgi:hypothetical protein
MTVRQTPLKVGRVIVVKRTPGGWVWRLMERTEQTEEMLSSSVFAEGGDFPTRERAIDSVNRNGDLRCYPMEVEAG